MTKLKLTNILIFKYFEYQLHCEIEILAFSRDISELSIRYTGEIINGKLILSPQDFLDRTLIGFNGLFENDFHIKYSPKLFFMNRISSL